MITLETKDTQIIEKTKELCQVILGEEQFKSLRAKIDAFMADNAAQEQYSSVLDKREYLAHLQEQGIELTDEQIKEFEVARDALLANNVAKEYLDAQQSLSKMQSAIMGYVSGTIELGRVPTAEELAPKGGCCGGGCGTGGGGGGCG